MWAYIALNVIVKVEQRPNSTGKEVEEQVTENSNGATTKEKQKCSTEWPKFSLIGIMRDLYISIDMCQADWKDLPIPDAPIVSGCEGGFVRIWDAVNNRCPAMHMMHKVRVMNFINSQQTIASKV